MITYTLNQYGLREKDMAYMNQLFQSHPEIEKVILYGSRARKEFRRGSDVDLALMGEQVTFETVSSVLFNLEEESPTLLFFDVLHYDSLKNENLKKEIEEDGDVIYEKVI